MAMDYKNAGVDIEAGYESVELMKKFVKGTMRPEVLGGLGGFSGAFSLKAIKDMEDPVLLSGTDGCGTKVKLAFLLDKHDTIGIDAVAMCVNDVACAGGEPLFFLDYIACGKNYPEKIATIVSGVAEGCKQSGAALIGGETAEHPAQAAVLWADLLLQIHCGSVKTVPDGSEAPHPASQMHRQSYPAVPYIQKRGRFHIPLPALQLHKPDWHSLSHKHFRQYPHKVFRSMLLIHQLTLLQNNPLQPDLLPSGSTGQTSQSFENNRQRLH